MLHGLHISYSTEILAERASFFVLNEKILLNESFYTINSNSPLSNLHTPTENQHSFYFFQNFTNSTSSIVWKLKTQMRWEFLRTLVCYLRKICKRHLSQYWTQYIRISGKDGDLWTGGNWETEMNVINLDMSVSKLMLQHPYSPPKIVKCIKTVKSRHISIMMLK